MLPINKLPHHAFMVIILHMHSFARVYSDNNRQWHEEQEVYFWKLSYENKPLNILETCFLVNTYNLEM